MGHITPSGPPGVSHQPAQHWAAGEADVWQQSDGLSQPSLASCPGCQGAQCPGSARESLQAASTVGRLLTAPQRGSSAHCCSLRDPPGPRHQTKPWALPRDFPTEPELGLAHNSEGQPNFLPSYIQLFSSSGKYGFGASNSHPNNIAEICTYLLWYVCMIPTS